MIFPYGPDPAMMGRLTWSQPGDTTGTRGEAPCIPTPFWPLPTRMGVR